MDAYLHTFLNYVRSPIFIMATIPVNKLTGVIDLEEEIGSGAYGVVKFGVSTRNSLCC